MSVTLPGVRQGTPQAQFNLVEHEADSHLGRTPTIRLVAGTMERDVDYHVAHFKSIIYIE